MSSGEAAAERRGRLASEWEQRTERNARRLAGTGAVVALVLGGAMALAGAGPWWWILPPAGSRSAESPDRRSPGSRPIRSYSSGRGLRRDAFF